MIRKGTLTLCALLLVLAPVWGQDVAAILASDPTRYTAKDLPALLRAQEAAEAAGNQRAVEYLVTLRMVAQLQDPSHGTLRGEGGLPLSRSQVEADLARLREKLARLRTEGAASGPATAARDVEVKGPGEFFNRELSFLEFNRRVVAMAADANHPLMERVRFLSIASANLDEFFSIRVAGLHQDALHGTGAARSDGATPAETLAAIDREARALEAEQQRLWNEVLKPALAREGIEVLELTEADARTRRALDQVLQREILPKVEVETFTGEAQLRAGRPQLVFELPGGEQRVVRLPSELPTWIEVPGPEGTRRLVRTQEALLAHYRQAWSARGGAVRLTQNQDLWGREGTAGHRYGAPVRIETNLPQDLREGLAERIGLRAEDVYTQREVGLAETAELSELVERSELRFERIAGNETNPLGAQPFERIRAGDVLLHHPYDSFERVVEWLKAAAVDPKVEAIRISLYRTGMDSKVIEALELAARNGKQVTALVELKARFDEPANVHNTERLRAAGVEVIHGAHGHKVHAKIAQVVRREGTNRVLYTHMATGNYHPGSARFYTDLALLTADRAIGSDVEKIFEQLRTGGQGPLNLEKVLQAPYTLRSTIVQKIDAEAQAAREGRPARIVAKMNSLNDPEIVRALYRASQAGVEIDLVVRGLCTLRPGVPGLSETIRVRSVLGQYLEHSRVYQFHAGGKVETYISSADWMARNTTRRVETAVPVEDPRLKAQLDALLRTYLRDTAGSFRLRENGKYERVRAEEGVVESAAQREVRERMASAPDLASADQLAAAPEAWRPNLALLDEGLRARHGMGLEVIEHEAARLGGAARARSPCLGAAREGLQRGRRGRRRADPGPGRAAEPPGRQKRGDPQRALLAAGSKGRAPGRPRGQGVAESILGRYRRADRDRLAAHDPRGAGHQLAGAGKFTLAIFLQEFGYALASRDPLRLEEFFDYVATTEFYMEYGLFVAGATAGQAGYTLAYQKYPQALPQAGVLPPGAQEPALAGRGSGAAPARARDLRGSELRDLPELPGDQLGAGPRRHGADLLGAEDPGRQGRRAARYGLGLPGGGAGDRAHREQRDRSLGPRAARPPRRAARPGRGRRDRRPRARRGDRRRGPAAGMQATRRGRRSTTACSCIARCSRRRRSSSAGSSPPSRT
ncbi:MAG: polyphosphate kinase 1 [Planctomycetota bacterium]